MAYKQQKFLTDLEAGSLRSGCPHGWVRAPFWVAVGLLVPTHNRRASELCRVSFIRVLIPLMRTVPFWSNHLPKVPPPNTISLGMRSQHRNFGFGHRHPVYSKQSPKLLHRWCCVFQPASRDSIWHPVIPPLGYWFDYWGKVVITRSLHCKFLFFPWGPTLGLGSDICDYPVFNSFCF